MFGSEKKPVLTLMKISEEQQMCYGWASVISVDGEPVIDIQGDIIDAAELEKASTEFMIDVRHAMEMHQRDENRKIQPEMIRGMVVHSFPLTADIAKSLGIETDREGWIVGVKVTDPVVWAKVKDGTYKAFSFGGVSQFEELEA